MEDPDVAAGVQLRADQLAPLAAVHLRWQRGPALDKPVRVWELELPAALGVHGLRRHAHSGEHRHAERDVPEIVGGHVEEIKCVRTGTSSLEQVPDRSRSHSVKVARDSDLSGEESDPALARKRRIDGDHLDDRLAGARDDERLTAGSGLDEPRQVRLGLSDVDSAHGCQALMRAATAQSIPPGWTDCAGRFENQPVPRDAGGRLGGPCK